MINIVLCTDERYAPYCAVVILTTILNSKVAKNLRFYILTPGLEEKTKLLLEEMVYDNNASIQIIDVDNTLTSDINLKRFGPSSVIRLNLHKYLPADCTRAIYLDCDLLVLGDITELWELSLNNKPVGAIIDLCSPKEFSKRPIDEPYFNSGVLLIDLNLWKRLEIGQRSIEYIAKNYEKLNFFDQDALNHVLSKNWQPLNLAWNFQPAAYSALEKDYDYLRDRKHELQQAVHNPKIVHFIGGVKPWHGNCEHPLQDLFIEYSKQTPWPIDKKSLLETLTFKERARLALKYLKRKRRLKLLKYNH